MSLTSVKTAALALCAGWLVAAQTPCQTQVLQSSPPSNAAVQLQSYSYCGGTLFANAYIENLDYDKIVTLYYEDGQGNVTPLTAVSFGYNGSIDGTNYENWSATAGDVYYDGISKFTNITFQATDIHQTYSQQLNLPVVASGDAPPKIPHPKPYAVPKGLQSDITSWLAVGATSQSGLAKDRLLANIHVNDSAIGTVIAAQSYSNPDYAYNWVRDSSLTMDVVASLYAAADSTTRPYYQKLLFNYAIARATEQNDPNLQTGLGEPKFFLNNSVYTGPWGRPQNDGPATASITLMEFSNSYLANGGSMRVIKNRIYDSNSNSKAPVLKDLLFVANNWSSPTFDIWEEEEGDQFYDRLVSHRALTMGAAFATNLGDDSTAATLSQAAAACAATLPQFWNAGRDLILYEYGPVLHGKYSYKDTAVLLGIVHGYAGDGIFSFSNPQVLATAYQIATCFQPIYAIAGTHRNAQKRVLGTPIGRYPEDTYNGTATDSLGNPWYLCTATMAEIFYRAAMELQSAPSIKVTPASIAFWKYFSPGYKYKAGQVFKKGNSQNAAMLSSLAGWGDAFMRTIQYYTPQGGHLTEEYSRDTGVPVGAQDLTWSYAALLTASFARAQLAGNTTYIASLANLALPSTSTSS